MLPKDPQGGKVQVDPEFFSKIFGNYHYYTAYVNYYHGICYHRPVMQPSQYVAGVKTE